MRKKNFILILVLLAIISGVVLKIGEILGFLNEIWWLYSICVVFFTLFTVLMYYLSTVAANSPNKNLFIQIVMLGVLIKMIFTATLIFVYRELVKPYDNWFLLYIAIVYFLYTIFEVRFMSNIGKGVSSFHDDE